VDSFGDVLAEFKAREEECVENVAPLLEDASLRNALVAWKSVAIEHKSNGGCPHKDETSRWNWLWQQIEYDQSTFGTVSGAKPAEVVNLITRLIGLRLVYPDGTINQMARQYLQAMILAKLASPKRPGRPKKSDDKKG